MSSSAVYQDVRTAKVKEKMRYYQEVIADTLVRTTIWVFNESVVEGLERRDCVVREEPVCVDDMRITTYRPRERQAYSETFTF